MSTEIERVRFGTKIYRFLAWPYRQTRWEIQRLWLLWKFIRCAGYARTLELKWQDKQQFMNNLSYSHNPELFHEAKGFVEGVKWCLEEGWNDETVS